MDLSAFALDSKSNAQEASNNPPNPKIGFERYFVPCLFNICIEREFEDFLMIADVGVIFVIRTNGF